MIASLSVSPRKRQRTTRWLLSAMIACVYCLVLPGCTSQSEDSPADKAADHPRSPAEKSSRIGEGSAGNGSTPSQVSTEADASASSPPVDSSKAAILALVEQGRIDEAWNAVQSALLENATDPDLLVLAAQVQSARGDHDGARALLGSIESEDPNIMAMAYGETAMTYIAQGRLSDAVPHFHKILNLIPNQFHAHRTLARIYNAQGRRFEAAKHLLALLKMQRYSPVELAMLCDLETHFRDEEFAPLSHAQASEAHHNLTYDAREALISRNHRTAKRLLIEALSVKADHVEAWVWLGFVHAQQEEWSALAQWYQSKPQDAEAHPIYWIVIGLWYAGQEQPAKATAAYLQAFRLNPSSILICVGLGQTLPDLGEIELAKAFREREAVLRRTISAVAGLMKYRRGPEAIGPIATAYEELDIPMLSEAWTNLAEAVAKDSNSGHTEPLLVTQSNRLDSVSLLKALEKLELPQLVAIDPAEFTTTAQSQVDRSHSEIESFAFEDVTRSVGLAGIKYDWGVAADEKVIPAFRALGGGVGVLDYDTDGTPDLYFEVAGGHPRDPASNKPNRLFRNLDGRYEEVPEQYAAADVGYGQGIICQDIDQDGADDLIVCNIGSVRIYQNLGDGSFNSPIDLPLHKDNIWVSTVAVADFSGDQLPDIYGVTYYGSVDYFDKKCIGPDGQPVGCAPGSFPHSPDYLWINNGDGSWRDASDVLTGHDSHGRGLCGLTTDLDGKPGLEIYIANDSTPNDLLHIRPNDHGELQVLNDLTCGARTSGGGKPEGSMGVGIGDIDRNGLEDLVVCNYYNESNRIYLQRDKNFYEDATRGWNPTDIDIPLVSFGAQCVDFDNNGWQDLMIVNGHVDDRTRFSEPFRMRPLLYRNTGRRFLQIEASTQTPYFARPTLARSLAQLDFDGDRRQDMLVTYCDEPSTLLRNVTPAVGNTLRLRLVGVQSERAAIGAVVELKAGEETWRQSLALGEGYYSSNQRVLTVGLGDVETIDSMEIRWPSGQTQNFDEVTVVPDYRLIEGEGLESEHDR